MTRKQAFLAALRLETPDVVPVSPLIHSRYAHKLLGRTDWKAVFEVHQMLGSTHFRGPIGVAWAVEGPPFCEVHTRVLQQDGVYRVEETVYSAPGVRLRAVDKHGMIPHDPITHKRTEYPIKTVDDWAFYKRMLEDWLARPGHPFFATAAEAFEVMGEDGVPSVGISSAFSALGAWRGMQELIYDLYDIPDLLHELFELQVAVNAKHVDAFLASPCEVLFYDICWATGANLSPKMFEECVLPDMTMVCEKVRAVPGKFVGFYTLGRMRELMPIIMKAGPHFVETFEPNEGDLTLAEAKRLYGRDTCIMGNYDCLVLAFGSVEDARREALRCLQEAMAGGGYIMVSGDEVPADAKWENLVAWVETVAEHGRY